MRKRRRDTRRAANRKVREPGVIGEKNTKKGKCWSWSASGERLFVSGNKRGFGSLCLSDDPSLAGSRLEEDRRRAEGGDKEGMDDSSINAK